MRLFNVCSVSRNDVSHEVLSRSVSGSGSCSKQVELAIHQAQENMKELARVGLVLAKFGPTVNAAGNVGCTIQSEIRQLDQHFSSLSCLATKLQASSDQLKFLKTENKKSSCFSQSRLSKSEAAAYALLLIEHDEQATKQMLVQHQEVMLSSNKNLNLLRSVESQYLGLSSDSES